MSYGLILLLAALQAGLYVQAPEMENRNTVRKVCGQVKAVEFNATSYSSHYQRAAITKANVLLYRRAPKKKCCAPDDLIAEISTDSGGEFEFKDSAPGQYWVVVTVGKKKHKLAVTLAASDEKGDEDCSLLNFEVINGRELRLTRAYRVH